MTENASMDRPRSLTLDQFESDETIDDVLDLSCPGCGNDLLGDALFDSHRICGSCRRHFPMRPRERITLISDPGSFSEINQALLSADPVRFGNLGEAGELHRSVVADAVVTGIATFGGREAVVVAMDDSLIGPVLGAVTGEKTVAALETALQRRVPCVTLISGGTARTDPGTLSLVQANRLAATFARLHVSGIPVIGVLLHPTSAEMFHSLASHCDLLVAEPDARLGGWSDASGNGPASPAELMESGMLDSVVDRVALQGFLDKLMNLITSSEPSVRPSSVTKADPALPSAREALAACEQRDRPTARDIASEISTMWIPVRGDRLERNDDAVIGGIARVQDTSLVMLAFDRTADLPTLSSVRKATRLARFAGHLDLPLLIIVDTSPEALRVTPEFAVGQGAAKLASVLSLLPVPVVSVAVGAVGGPLGLAALQADRVLMQTNAVMCNIGGGERWSVAGRRWGIEDFGIVAPAHECLRLGLAEAVIDEPRPSAATDPESANQRVCLAAISAISEIGAVGQRRLLDRRGRRLRMLGQQTPAARAAATNELIDLQDWQRSLSETMDEWRERWEQRRSLTSRKPLPRPDLAELGSRLRARRTELLERTGIGERLANLEDELRARQSGRDQEIPKK